MANASSLRTAIARRPVVIAAGFLLLLGVTRFFPNGNEGGGTPVGVLLLGLINGSLVALTAIGIVLVYRTSRVINFAQAAVGAAGAVFTYEFVEVTHLPYILSLVFGIVIAAGLGLVVELVLRRFFDAPRLVVTVGTIGVMGLITTVGFGTIFSLPIWNQANRSITNARGGANIAPLKSFHFKISGYQFGLVHILALILAPLALLFVAWFLKRTRLGTAVRAAAENAERSEMLGINVKQLSMVVWTIAGALAGLGITLQLTAAGAFSPSASSTVEGMLPALAAAVLGGLVNIGTAAAAAIGVTILQEALHWSYSTSYEAIFAVVMLILIVAGPLLIRKARGRERESSGWEALEEARPIPRELVRLDEVRTWRNVVMFIVVAFALIFPWITTAGPTSSAGFAAITGIVILSLIVLTGWTGQVSLGQWGLVAVAALTGGSMISHLHWNFWVVLPLGGLVTAGVAGLLSIPAMRIRGLMLAVSTFAFSFVAWLVLFNQSWFGWLQPGRVDRPTLFLINFEDEPSMYYLALFAFALCYLLVRTLRRGRPGRIFLALRENEDDLTTVGVNPVTARITAFMLSGFLAGIAGVLLAVHQRAVTQQAFQPIQSVQLFLYAVIGGLGAPAGAIIGALVKLVTNSTPSDPTIAFFLNASFGVLFILYVAPRGLWGVVQSMRDQILRIISQRKGIVVPSLFADVDQEALEKRLVLVAEPEPGRGLASLAGDRRYRLSSELYGTELAGGGKDEERQTIATASQTMFERASTPGAPSRNGEG